MNEPIWPPPIISGLSAAHAAAGGADGALEGPASNVIDLFLHGAGERHDFHRRMNEIVPRDLGIGEARPGNIFSNGVLGSWASFALLSPAMKISPPPA